MRLALALASALVVLTPSPAWAHASVMSSYPVDGSVLKVVPDEVSVAFYGSIRTPARVSVVAPDGTELAQGDPVVAEYLVKQAVAPSSQTGTFTLSYGVVSVDDGHTVDGVASFTVGSVDTFHPVAARASDGFWAGPRPVLIAGGVFVVLAATMLRVTRRKADACPR